MYISMTFGLCINNIYKKSIDVCSDYMNHLYFSSPKDQCENLFRDISVPTFRNLLCFDHRSLYVKYVMHMFFNRIVSLCSSICWNNFNLPDFKMAVIEGCLVSVIHRSCFYRPFVRIIINWVKYFWKLYVRTSM